MPVSHVPPTDQRMNMHDLGVRLPLGPPNGRAPTTLTDLVILVITVQTPPTSIESPRLVDASPEFDLDSSDEEPDHRAYPYANAGPPLGPKWWAKTLVDL